MKAKSSIFFCAEFDGVFFFFFLVIYYLDPLCEIRHLRKTVSALWKQESLLFPSNHLILAFQLCKFISLLVFKDHPVEVSSSNCVGNSPKSCWYSWPLLNFFIFFRTWKGYSVSKGPNYAPKRKKVATDLTRENLQRYLIFLGENI